MDLPGAAGLESRIDETSMNSNSSNRREIDPEKMLDELFQIKELASDDFSTRTLGAVRRRKKRAKIIRLGAWTGAAAASIALFLVPAFNIFETQNMTAISSESPQTVEVAEVQPNATDWTTADELTLALRAAQEGHPVLFYSRALALEELLADAAALSDRDTEEAFEFLTLLAEN